MRLPMCDIDYSYDDAGHSQHPDSDEGIEVQGSSDAQHSDADDDEDESHLETVYQGYPVLFVRIQNEQKNKDGGCHACPYLYEPYC